MRVATNSERDIAGTLMAVIMILVCAVGWWDTTAMEDPDSYVFPRAVMVAMVTFSLTLIVYNLVRSGKSRENGGHNGSNLRRALLVLVMLTGAGLMPYLGFILSGLVVFAALTGVAMYDPWTRFRMTVYPLSGIAIVIGFYSLFAKLLMVPLPDGALFD